ncbi:MAG: pentapeptide repeat-containing protein [bacterium]
MSDSPDYYLVLEVSRTATEVEIRTAYRRLAREHHPDANPSPEAEARMRRINEAWETLRDAVKRDNYDRLLRGTPRPAVRSVRRQPPPRRPAPAPAANPPAGQEPPAWFNEDAPRSKEGSVEFKGDPSINWYAKVGVREDAPRPIILKALSRMAGELNGSNITATEFTRRRNEMREAWAILGDQYMRAAYDRARKEPRPQPASSEAAPESPVTPPPGYRLGPITVNGHAVDKAAQLRGVDLRGADLRGLDLAGIDLREAKLQAVDFEAASLRGAKLNGSDLSGANLRHADLSNADASGATLAQADLSKAALHATNLFRTNLSGATLAGAVGPGVNFDYADLRRADLSGARITEQLIRRAKLGGTVMPDGSVEA